jgi:small multidrug resistance pump
MPAAWLLLLAAIGLEVLATSLLPKADGFRSPGWSAAVLAGYAAAIWLLTLVVRDIPVSVAYAVWAGLGTAGIAVVGYLWLDESMGLVKIMAIAMIIAGVLVLNLHGAGAH